MDFNLLLELSIFYLAAKRQNETEILRDGKVSTFVFMIFLILFVLMQYGSMSIIPKNYFAALFTVRAYRVSHVKFILIMCILPKKDHQSHGKRFLTRPYNPNFQTKQAVNYKLIIYI